MCSKAWRGRVRHGTAGTRDSSRWGQRPMPLMPPRPSVSQKHQRAGVRAPILNRFVFRILALMVRPLINTSFPCLKPADFQDFFLWLWKNEARKIFRRACIVCVFFWKPPRNGNIWRRGHNGRTFCGDRRPCFLEGTTRKPRTSRHNGLQYSGEKIGKSAVSGRKAKCL